MSESQLSLQFILTQMIDLVRQQVSPVFAPLSIIFSQPRLLSMLSEQEIVQLLCLNREIKRELTQNTTVLNRIYWSRFLKPRDMFIHPFYYSTQYKIYQTENVEASLQTFKTQRIGKFQVMKNIKIELLRNLEEIVHSSEAKEIVDDIYETIACPPIPMPTLRKQTVGDYCTTSLQIHMAELNHRDNSLKMEEQVFLNMRMWFIQNHEVVLQQLLDNKNILINIRFQSENINSYESTTSPFLNIINLFLVLVDYHLESIKNCLLSQFELPHFEFLSEYVKRYNTFRDMVMAFEEKLGFMMELFTKAFNFIEKELEIYPGCSIWRTLMKKWVTKMHPFQQKNEQGFIQLLAKVRESNFQEGLQESSKFEECSERIKANFEMKKSQCSDASPMCSVEFDMISAEEPDLLTSILCEFIDYSIETSCNEYSIHWCQSSSQRLGKIYSSNERNILSSTKDLYKNWEQIFGDHLILQQVLERDVELLRRILKPTTLKYIIQECNIILCKNLKSSKPIKGQFQRIDDRIKYINEKRMICLQLSEEYKEFFDFDRTICLDKIENRIKSVGRKEHSEVVEVESPHPVQATLQQEI